MTAVYRYYVAAEPKRRHRQTNGRAYPDPKGVAYEQMLGFLMRHERKGPMLECFVGVQALFVTESKGDLDNLLKAVLDAGNGILWKDDRQIVEANAFKRKPTEGEPEFVELQVWKAEMEGDE